MHALESIRSTKIKVSALTTIKSSSQTWMGSYAAFLRIEKSLFGEEDMAASRVG